MSNRIQPVLAAAIMCAPLADAEPDERPSLGKQLAEKHIARFTDGGMERWQEAMAPGMAHRFLAERLVGEWKTTARIINMGEPGPEMVWTATAEPILDGRFIEHRSSGEMMGMPLESRMIVGYDNVKKLFHATFFDTTSTGVRTLWGNLDRDGDTLTLVGRMNEPMTGEVGKHFLMSWTFNDDGSNEYEVKEILYGEPFTVVRARSERVD